MTTKKCLICTRELKVKDKRQKFCSRACYAKNRSENIFGENHPMWKGGVTRNKILCKFCGKNFLGDIKKRKFCSKLCSNKWFTQSGSRKGSSNGMWNGGMHIGIYKIILKPNHPNSNANGYIREHRFLMSEKIGRPLRKDEEVHHINGNKLDNRIENLQLLTKREHSKITCLTRPSRGSSKFKGVSYSRERNKWCSGIVIDGKKLESKRFDNEESAHKHYQALCKKYHNQSTNKFQTINPI